MRGRQSRAGANQIECQHLPKRGPKRRWERHKSLRKRQLEAVGSAPDDEPGNVAWRPWRGHLSTEVDLTDNAQVAGRPRAEANAGDRQARTGTPGAHAEDVTLCDGEGITWLELLLLFERRGEATVCRAQTSRGACG